MARINLLLTLLLTLLLSAPASYGQQDINDVLDNILKDKNLTDQKKTDSQQLQAGRIDNIPVKIVFNADAANLSDGATLTVSAFAPTPANIRRSAHKMLGQTNLLLTDLGSPLEVMIATPSAITQDLDYIRIEATITDNSGSIIFALKEPGKYDGYQQVNLILTHSRENAAPKPKKRATKLVSKTVRGKIKLSGRAPKFAGSNLVTRLVEDGLAGGNSNIVLGEMRQSLDGKHAPFAFKFVGKVDTTDTGMPLAIETWIEDWSGRKTHVTPSPTPYTGQKTRYRIKLDAIGPQVYNPMPSNRAIKNALSRTVSAPKMAAATYTKPTTKLLSKSKKKTRAVKNTVVKPKPVVQKKQVKTQPKPKPVNLAKKLPPFQKITGKAHFNANKGLPRGSVLIAELERRNNGKRPPLLASTRVFLDGLSGAVPFRLRANTADLDPALPSAKLHVRIVDKNGKLFFSNLNGTKVRTGFNAVTLTTSPNY